MPEFDHKNCTFVTVTTSSGNYAVPCKNWFVDEPRVEYGPLPYEVAKEFEVRMITLPYIVRKRNA